MPPCILPHKWISSVPRRAAFSNINNQPCSKTFGGRGGGGAQAGHKALHTCTSWYAYGAMFGSSLHGIAILLSHDTFTTFSLSSWPYFVGSGQSLHITYRKAH